jgi:hypothetical protein
MDIANSRLLFVVVVQPLVYFAKVGVHPKLTECNIYVTMFLRVLKTFFLFLAWYSLFILAFGLGFFILLHTDRPELQQQVNPKRIQWMSSL